MNSFLDLNVNWSKKNKMAMNQIPAPLKKVDRVEIFTLIDNYADVLLSSTDIITRPSRLESSEISRDTFLAEHGLSLLVNVYQGEKRHTILFDTGHTRMGVPHNMEKLGIKAESIEAIVLTHAHVDHTGSLNTLLEKIPNPIPLVVHPDAFLFPRFIQEKDGTKRRYPRTLVREELTCMKVELLESKGPRLIVEDMIMVTGEVKRTTEFEKGLPNAFIERNGKMEPDPLTEDQALIIHLKDKGLVVISGCSHAGIINTVHYAKNLTGEKIVHAILGGFHLTGPYFEKVIDKTIRELKKEAPQVLVPMHCTGWKAMRQISLELPSLFILNSVGSKISLS